jgi:acetyl-CoA carboxylase biotin carboxyl carrier protein
MKFQEIQDLIKLIAEEGIDEFSYEQKDIKFSIVNNREVKVIEGSAPAQPQFYPMQMHAPQPQMPAPVSAPAAPKVENTETPAKPTASNLIEVKSPIVGTFYRSASPEKPAYVKVGDKVTKGNVVCIVEAMKLFNEIESEFAGTVVKVLVEDAQPVEYDQVLFLLEA